MKPGIGSTKPQLVLYIDKRPSVASVLQLEKLRPAFTGEVPALIEKCGNHWRKIFSILAKLSFGLDTRGCCSWQHYRDEVLLTEQGAEALLFCNELKEFSSQPFHLIGGERFFKEFDFAGEDFCELDAAGKVRFSGRVFQTPYFDCRQFPNALIEEVIAQMLL